MAMKAKIQVTSVSLPADVREKLKKMAKAEGRSVSSMVTELVRRSMQEQKAA